MSEIHHDKIQELKVRAEYFEDLVFTLKSRFDVLDRERDSLKRQLAERDAACAAMREALEEDARNFEAVDAYYYSGDVARIRKVLHSSSAGKDLLEWKRKAEELLRRFQEIERLPQCDELLMLRDDINSFLKGEDEDMTGMFMNCTKLPPKPLLSVSKRGGKNA